MTTFRFSVLGCAIFLAACSRQPDVSSSDAGDIPTAETGLALKLANQQDVIAMPDPATMNFEFEQARRSSEQYVEAQANLSRAIEAERLSDLAKRIETLERERMQDALTRADRQY